MNDDKIGGARSKSVGDKKCIQDFSCKVWLEEDAKEDLVVEGGTIMWMLKEIG